jgi:hypothetical protein
VKLADFRNNKKKYLKAKIYELLTNSKKKKNQETFIGRVSSLELIELISVQTPTVF